jgi:hypothetical protein
MQVTTMMARTPATQGRDGEPMARSSRRRSPMHAAWMAALGLCLSLAAMGTLAHNGHDRGQSGTIRCGGNNFYRAEAREMHTVSYVMRNMSSRGSISIDRIVFWDATGAVLYDSKVNVFPMFGNRVLGPNDQVLRPNQTGQMEASSVLPLLESWQRPVQIEINWSSRDRVPPLNVTLVRLVKLVDAQGKQGQETTRD